MYQVHSFQQLSKRELLKSHPWYWWTGIIAAIATALTAYGTANK